LEMRPLQVWVVDDGAPDGAVWVMADDNLLAAIRTSGRLAGSWTITAGTQLLVQDGWFGFIDPATRTHTPLFEAASARRLTSIERGPEAATGGTDLVLTRTGLLETTKTGIAVERRLGWPGLHAQAWVTDDAIATLDEKGIWRLCLPPPRTARTGARLLAWCVTEIKAGRTAAVGPQLDTLLKLLPESADARWCAGMVAASEGHTDDAEGHWKEAVRLNPGLIRARFSLAHSRASRDNWDGVRELLEPVLIARYQYALTVWYLLDDAMRTRNAERARRFYELFRTADVSIDPEFDRLRDPKRNARWAEIQFWIWRYMK
ncbi:MAG: tetratricopeptide repeat protein, partial [Planctomycetota bacterium]